MATKTSPKKPTTRKPTAKKTVKKPAAHKVDYYPNRMSLAVAALAAVSLVLFATLAFYNN